MTEVLIGNRVLQLAAHAESELVLCAPFVKAPVVERVLAAAAVATEIRLITRWRPEEVAAGVSDVEVLELVEARRGTVLLHDRLHAKYYRSEIEALLGSANLTAAALGWREGANLELLVDSPLSNVMALERQLVKESTVATSAVAREVRELADLLAHDLKPPAQVAVPELRGGSGAWLPRLRQPEDLYIAYAAGTGRLSRVSAVAALADLASLELPGGLSRDSFNALVGHRLLQQGTIKSIDELLQEPRRFGEVADALCRVLQVPREQADLYWQTLMRWLLEFLPGRYVRRVARHSEIVYRAPTGG